MSRSYYQGRIRAARNERQRVRKEPKTIVSKGRSDEDPGRERGPLRGICHHAQKAGSHSTPREGNKTRNIPIVKWMTGSVVVAESSPRFFLDCTSGHESNFSASQRAKHAVSGRRNCGGAMNARQRLRALGKMRSTTINSCATHPRTPRAARVRCASRLEPCAPR